MGVAILQPYPVPGDKTAPQVIELLQKRIVNLGANQTGQFLVDCETYYSTQASQQKTLNVLHNSEHPATVFSVLDNTSNPNGKPVTFTSDTLFDLLLLKLGNVYSKNSKFKIESKGPRFEVGDFLVKLGVVSVAGSFKGILVEVEYLPCIVIDSCKSMLIEFMQGFLGSIVGQQTTGYFNKKMQGEIYTPVDTVQQYLEHFNAFRKNINLHQQINQ